MLNVWFAKATVIAATIAMIAIRAPHGQRSRSVKTKKSHRGTLEAALLAVMCVAFFVPIVWIVAPFFELAEYPLNVAPLGAGIVCYVVGLWLFLRSHADLGTNWSVTLEVREQHRPITRGIYHRIRHPMYTALLLFAVGQALVIPNWIAGLSYLVAMILLIALRLPAEERMMHAHFGDEYAAYALRTKRLVPGLW